MELAPILKSGIGDVKGWEDVKLLTVAINRLKRWTRPGLLCIGDAAHVQPALDLGQGGLASRRDKPVIEPEQKQQHAADQIEVGVGRGEGEILLDAHGQNLAQRWRA